MTNKTHNRAMAWGASMILFIFLTACGLFQSPDMRTDKDIISLSTISGSVNGSIVAGKISATFNTGRGGRSTCEFARLPEGFTPGTFGTHT